MPEGEKAMLESLAGFSSFSVLIPPNTSKIFEPLLNTLKRLIKESPNGNGFVDKDIVMVETLRETGIEGFVVDVGSELGWNRNQLYTTILEAFRNGSSVRNTFPLFKTGQTPDSWGLTFAGIAVDNPNVLKGKNITSVFLDTRIRATGGLNGKFLKGLRAAIGSKLQLSVSIGILEDHVQTCLMRLVQRDALRERILSGIRIPDGQISSYAVRSAFNDCRDSGTEPIFRAMCGAKTERERSRDNNVYAPTGTRLVWRRAEIGADEFDDFDVVDTTTPGSLDKLVFNEIMTGLERIARQNYPESAIQIIDVFRARAEGISIRYLSSNVKDKVQDCVEKAADSGLFRDFEGINIPSVF